MPNFWSKAEQFIGESLNGPRTKDKEYEKITEKMKAVELGLINLKQILQKLQVASNQMELVFKELNMVCYQIYQDSPYLNAIEGIQLKNKNIEKEFSNFSKIISNIFSKTSELTKVFNSSGSIEAIWSGPSIFLSKVMCFSMATAPNDVAIIAASFPSV